MHEHDQEIIMALAEGTLDDIAAATARADMAECAECTRDLDLQRFALSLLDEAPAVFLTDTESARLHEGLKREFPAVTPRAVPAKSRFAWSRWVPTVAGAAAVFLVMVMVLPGLRGGSNDSAESTFAAADGGSVNDEQAALDRSTVAAAATIAPETLALDDTAGEYTLGDDSATEATEAPAVATATTAAPPGTTTSQTRLADVLPVVGFGDISDEIRAEIINELLTDPDGVRLRDESAKSTTFDTAACFAQLAVDLDIPTDSEMIVVGLLTGDDGEERLVIASVPADVNETILVVVSYPSCEVFQTSPAR